MPGGGGGGWASREVTNVCRGTGGLIFVRGTHSLSPDLPPSPTAREQELAEAYAILSDPTKRRQYDAGATFDGAGDVEHESHFDGHGHGHGHGHGGHGFGGGVPGDGAGQAPGGGAGSNGHGEEDLSQIFGAHPPGSASAAAAAAAATAETAATGGGTGKRE